MLPGASVPFFIPSGWCLKIIVNVPVLGAPVVPLAVNPTGKFLASTSKLLKVKFAPVVL